MLSSGKSKLAIKSATIPCCSLVPLTTIARLLGTMIASVPTTFSNGAIIWSGAMFRKTKVLVSKTGSTIVGLTSILLIILSIVSICDGSVLTIKVLPLVSTTALGSNTKPSTFLASAAVI